MYSVWIADWTHVAKERDQWQSHVIMVMNSEVFIAKACVILNLFWVGLHIFSDGLILSVAVNLILIIGTFLLILPNFKHEWYGGRGKN